MQMSSKKDAIQSFESTSRNHSMSQWDNNSSYDLCYLKILTIEEEDRVVVQKSRDIISRDEKSMRRVDDKFSMIEHREWWATQTKNLHRREIIARSFARKF